MTDSVTFKIQMNIKNRYAQRSSAGMEINMSQIIKVYLSLFMITIMVLLGISLIGADTGVSNARA